MNSNAYKLIKETDRLPSPKGVALEILRLTEDDSTTIESLSSVIEADPAIASQLLKVVNSPLSGISRKIVSISRATIMMGFRSVASLALGLSLVSSNQKGGCSAFNYGLFWSESLGCGVAARNFAKPAKVSPDEAFTCGLLSQVGRLALASVYPDRYAQALGEVSSDPTDLSQLETDMFDINHNELAAEMMADWHLPVVFSDAVRTQENPNESGLEKFSPTHQLAKILNLSESVSNVLAAEAVDLDMLSSITNKAFTLGIRPDQVQESFDHIRDEWRDTGQIFSIKTKEVPTLAEIQARCKKIKSNLAKAGVTTPKIFYCLYEPCATSRTLISLANFWWS